MRTMCFVFVIIGFSFFNGDICAQSVKDINGNIYKTITIGGQTWFAENLRVLRYSNGDQIIYFEDNPDTYPREGQYVMFNSEGKPVAYNWYAVTDERGLCPTGWHVPSKSDWQELIKFLGENVTLKLKSKTGWGSQTESYGGYYATHICPTCFTWTDYKKQTIVCPTCNDRRYVVTDEWIPERKEVVNYNGNNSTGFTAMPFSGMRTRIATSKYEPYFTNYAGYWSSTIYESSGTRNSYGYTEAYGFFSGGTSGLTPERIDSFIGVRCIKD